jgi:hypothetical protein
MSTKNELLNELLDRLYDEMSDWYESESPSLSEAPLYLDVANSIGEKLTEVRLQTNLPE